MKGYLRLAAAITVGLSMNGIVNAQNYPTKPVRIVVGFPAGTTTDTVARLLAGPIQKQLGQPFIIEARPGAGGVIGANTVVKAEPDGYAVFFGSVTNLHPIFTKNNPVDAAKDFAPISDSMSTPYVLFASSKLGTKSLQEFVAHAKGLPPGTLNNALTIANQELVLHTVKGVTGLTYTNVPFINAAQFLPLLASGEISMHVNLFSNFQAPLQSGTVRALFVTASKRLPKYPDVPTAAEVGIPNMEAATFAAGFWAPRGTPRSITDRLSVAAQAAARAPEVIAQFQKLDYEPVGSTPEEQLRMLESGMKFWSNAARLSNYQPQ